MLQCCADVQNADECFICQHFCPKLNKKLLKPYHKDYKNDFELQKPQHHYINSSSEFLLVFFYISITLLPRPVVSLHSLLLGFYSYSTLFKLCVYFLKLLFLETVKVNCCSVPPKAWVYFIHNKNSESTRYTVIMWKGFPASGVWGSAECS